jgi:deoxyadenosine/deoxycytidine kinase
MNFCFKLVKPFSNIPKKHILLSIEGNIGAGKTTFLRLLKESLKIPFEVVPEPVADWQRFGDSNNKIDLLDLFYKDPKKYAYIFQSYCFFSRLKNWTLNQNNYDTQILIFERSIYSDK